MLDIRLVLSYNLVSDYQESKDDYHNQPRWRSFYLHHHLLHHRKAPRLAMSSDTTSPAATWARRQRKIRETNALRQAIINRNNIIRECIAAVENQGGYVKNPVLALTSILTPEPEEIT